MSDATKEAKKLSRPDIAENLINVAGAMESLRERMDPIESVTFPRDHANGIVEKIARVDTALRYLTNEQPLRTNTMALAYAVFLKFEDDPNFKVKNLEEIMTGFMELIIHGVVVIDGGTVKIPAFAYILGAIDAIYMAFDSMKKYRDDLERLSPVSPMEYRPVMNEEVAKMFSSLAAPKGMTVGELSELYARQRAGAPQDTSFKS